MGILGKIKDIFSISSRDEREFKAIISDSRKEYAVSNKYFWEVKINTISFYNNEIANWPHKKKVDFIIYCAEKIHEYSRSHNSFSTGDADYQENSVRESYIKYLFKIKLLLDDEDVERLQSAFSANRKWNWTSINAWPVSSLLNQLEKQYREQELSEKMIASLKKMRTSIQQIDNNYYTKEKTKLTEKIDAIIFQSENKEGAIKPTLFLGSDDFSAYANEIIQALPEEEKNSWYLLIAKAQKASGSKPSNKYLDETKSLIKDLGTERFKKTVNDWFVFLVNLKEKEHHNTHTYNNRTYTYITREYLSPLNIEAIKGFVWMCAHFHDSATIRNIANLAERSYQKIPEKGPAAVAVGNACLFMLYKSKGLDGIGQLSRLKLRIKQNSTQNLIEKYLLDAAKEQGMSVHEIEDIAVDEYDLRDGRKEIQFDDYKAEVKITGPGKSELNWFKADGTPQKSVPSFVKEKHAAKLKKLKDSIKQIDQASAAQRDRIDRMFRADRKWSMEDFMKNYFEHGLLSFLAKKIIWVFTHEGKSQSAIYLNNQWVNNDIEAVVPVRDSIVSLWHPAAYSTAEIKKWREFLVERQFLQPLKQAFREVYLLTDAEIKTKTYSNRMAAHLLKQHQFNVLAKTRGWKYALLGAYDDGRFNEAAEVKLPEFGLRAEYWVDEVNAENAHNDTGIWNYVATDQLRFVNLENDDLVDLINVPAIPFSEVLRDVDLFVGVASVGNDPTWQDSGGIPAYRDYWTTYSFGDLSEVAKNRKEILTGLIPRLKINQVTEIKDRFLVVKGKLRTYKIHFGSTNILMEPNDQYLCIVPDRSQKSFTENLFIPFEGDTGLSIILSKAFLLAADDRITDTTITSQINRK